MGMNCTQESRHAIIVSIAIIDIVSGSRDGVTKGRGRTV
jgi:hypothetical protein